MRHEVRFFFTALFLFSCILVSNAQEITGMAPGSPVSPEVEGGTVTLRFEGEYASEVKVAGNWLDSPVVMDKDGGVWSITFNELPGDFYSYKFIVDGVETLDPANSMVQRAGDDYMNFFVVDGVKSRNYKEISRRGNVDFVWYDSAILGSGRRMAIYTPYGYNPAGRKLYPVLYLLHGEGGDEESWLSMGRLAEVLDQLIGQGRAVPMIVVMPNCNPEQQAARTLGLPEVKNARTSSSSVFMSSFVNEIIPYVESHYRANPKKAYRCAAGISSGGSTVLNTAIMYPQLFDFLCPLSCGVEDNGHLTEDLLRIKYGGIKLFWTGCGTSDYGAYAPSQTLHETLSYIHLDHTFYVMNGGHEWKCWRQFLNNFAPMIFKYYTY